MSLLLRQSTSPMWQSRSWAFSLWAHLQSVFIGSHNVKIYGIRPADWPCYYASTALASFEGLLTNHLLSVPAPPVVSCYSNPALDSVFQSLTQPVDCLRLAIRTAVQLSYFARDSVSDTISLDTRQSLSFGCFVGIINGLVDLIDQADFCFWCLGVYPRHCIICSCFTYDAFHWLEQGFVCRFAALTPFHLSFSGRTRTILCPESPCHGKRLQQVCASTFCHLDSLWCSRLQVVWRPMDRSRFL